MPGVHTHYRNNQSDIIKRCRPKFCQACGIMFLAEIPLSAKLIRCYCGRNYCQTDNPWAYWDGGVPKRRTKKIGLKNVPRL